MKSNQNSIPNETIYCLGKVFIDGKEIKLTVLKKDLLAKCRRFIVDDYGTLVVVKDDEEQV